MKKFLKILFILCTGIVLIGLVAFGILYSVYNEPLPEGKPGPAADALAEKMLQAINDDAYQNTTFLEWSFRNGAHTYKWNKANGKVQVAWQNYQVKLNLNNPSKSEVLAHGALVTGEAKAELLATAMNYFNNDSFWLVAPFKIFDKGTKRSIVTLKDGTKGLMVSYASGGTTPGDTYLWKLLPNGFPRGYQMWVQIIPIGGLEASWDDWQIMENGLALPRSHKLGPFTLTIGDVRAYN